MTSRRTGSRPSAASGLDAEFEEPHTHTYLDARAMSNRKQCRSLPGPRDSTTDTWTQKHVLRPMLMRKSASSRKWNRRPIIHETFLLHALQEPELSSIGEEVLQLLLMNVILQVPQYH